jgi:hypothetical protein
MYNKVSFLGLSLAPDIWSLAFFFRSPAASQTLIQLLLNGTRMSSSMYNKVSFLGLSLAPDIWSLAFFFRSHADFETLRLLAHGSRMSSSMNNKSFLCWIYFLPYLISGYFLFLLIPCRLGIVEDAAASWVPHVIPSER